MSVGDIIEARFTVDSERKVVQIAFSEPVSKLEFDLNLGWRLEMSLHKALNELGDIVYKREDDD